MPIAEPCQQIVSKNEQAQELEEKVAEQSKKMADTSRKYFKTLKMTAYEKKENRDQDGCSCEL